MNAALWGTLTALVWGSSDYIARFNGRAIGHANTLLGMLICGATLLSIYVVISDMPFLWDWSAAWMLVVSGIGIMIATLLLYQAITRGPISVASPIVGSYPALTVLLAFALGSRPSPTQWMAMAVVLCGVITVARYAPTSNEEQHHDPAYNRATVLIAAGSAICFAVAILVGQMAAPIFGDLETTWIGRLIGLVSLLGLFAWHSGYTINLPRRTWPLLGAQGVLDSSGYVFIFTAAYMPNSEIAAVTASAFGAITVLLARFFLKELISLPQWAGIIAVFGGVAALAS